jgi:hypothetical protein
MAEVTSINIGGTWKTIDDCDVNIGGSWKQVNTISANIGGTWKTVWTSGAFDISSIDGAYSSTEEDGFTTTGSLTVGSAGNVDYTGDTLGTTENDDWWLPNGTVQGTWHVKLTHDSGTNQRSSGTALNTWTAVGSFTMNFSKAHNGSPDPDSTIGNYTLSFSDDGGSTTHDSVAITITLQEQSA